jgi:hypothetical protein
MAKDRLKRRPDRYLNHVYGEAEVGGTSWLYLTGRPVSEVGLLDLPETPPPQLTEAIQHGIFRYGVLPVAFYGLLAGLMWRNRPKPAPAQGRRNREGRCAAGRSRTGGGGSEPAATERPPIMSRPFFTFDATP